MESSLECIVIDHRCDQIYASNPINNSLDDTDSDIKIIVENSVFNTHKPILESMADKRRLVMRKLKLDHKNVYVISGVNAKSFEMVLVYLYNRYISFDHNTGIQFVLTLIKLNFIGLAKEIAYKYCLRNDRCEQCGYRLSIQNCDQLYHIANYRHIDYYPLITKCRIFMSLNSQHICQQYLYDNCDKTDPINSFTFMYSTPRYSNYIQFLIPYPFVIYFNIMISTDRQNWTKIVDNDYIACESWNWFYFRETRVKYIRITCVMLDTNGVESPFNIKKHFDPKSFTCKYVNSDLKFDQTTNYLVPTHNAIQYPVKYTKHLFSDNLFTYCMSDVTADMKEKYYYYHFIGDGKPLYFYLPQTCSVNAIRFRLWDIDSREYDYSVSVKSYENDGKSEWTRIGNYYNRSSWQTVHFGRYLDIRWISITGLKGPNYDKEFAIIDIECPPQDIIYKNNNFVSNKNTNENEN